MQKEGYTNRSRNTQKTYWKHLKLVLGLSGILLAGSNGNTTDSQSGTQAIQQSLKEWETLPKFNEFAEDQEMINYKQLVQKTKDTKQIQEDQLQMIESDAVLKSIRDEVHAKKGQGQFDLKKTKQAIQETFNKYATLKLYITLKENGKEPETIEAEALKKELEQDNIGMTDAVAKVVEATRDYFQNDITDPKVQECLDAIWDRIEQGQTIQSGTWIGGAGEPLQDKYSETIGNLLDIYDAYDKDGEKKELTKVGKQLIAANTYTNKSLKEETPFQKKLKEIEDLEGTLTELKKAIEAPENQNKYKNLYALPQTIKDEGGAEDLNKIIASYNSIQVVNPKFQEIPEIKVEENALTYLALDQNILKGPTAEELQDKLTDLEKKFKDTIAKANPIIKNLNARLEQEKGKKTDAENKLKMTEKGLNEVKAQLLAAQDTITNLTTKEQNEKEQHQQTQIQLDKVTQELDIAHKKLKEYEDIQFDEETWTKIAQEVQSRDVDQATAEKIKDLDSLAQVIKDAFPKEFTDLITTFNYKSQYANGTLSLQQIIKNMSTAYTEQAASLKNANKKMLALKSEIKNLKQQITKTQNTNSNSSKNDLDNTNWLITQQKNEIDLQHKEITNLNNQIAKLKQETLSNTQKGGKNQLFANPNGKKDKTYKTVLDARNAGFRNQTEILTAEGIDTTNQSQSTKDTALANLLKTTAYEQITVGKQTLYKKVEEKKNE